MTDREKKILAIVQRLSQVQGANPAPDEHLFQSGILDSFGLPDLIAALETEFAISIPDSDLLPQR